MPDLSFAVENAEPVEHAASPLLALTLRIHNADSEEQIQSVMLQVQVQIEAVRRLYDATEQARLRDLFGEPQRWNQTLRSMLWMQTYVSVRPFVGETRVKLLLPCTFDFNVASTKYFAGLAAGNIPLCLLFSGTIFYECETGLSIAQIPWEREARFSLPVATWKAMMDHYYPNAAWLTLRRDVFERLDAFKREHGFPTWEQTVERLLP